MGVLAGVQLSERSAAQGVAGWAPLHDRQSPPHVRRCGARHPPARDGMWCLLPPVQESSCAVASGGGAGVMECEISLVKRKILKRNEIKFMSIL